MSNTPAPLFQENTLSSVAFKPAMQLLLEEARAMGATAAEVSASLSTGYQVDVRLGDVETIEHNHDKGVSVTVYRGQCKGSATTSDLSEDALRKTVLAAMDIAQFTQPDPCVGLAEASRYATTGQALDLDHPTTFTMDDAIASAIQCEQSALKGAHAIHNSEGAGFSATRSFHAYANTQGFWGSQHSSLYSRHCALVAKDAAGMERDGAHSSARRVEDLQTAESVSMKAVERTVRRMSPQKLKTQTVPVIFETPMALSLWGHALRAMNGHAIYRDASFLCGQLEKRVFPEFVTLTDDPFVPKGFNSTAFDGEGVLPQKNNLIEKGIWTQYLLDSYAARKLSKETTGHAGGTYNITVNHTVDTLEALLKTMGTGVLVTELMGQGVNGVTGDYSRGASGFWVENGVIQYPVSEFTVAGHLLEMYQNMVAIAGDTDSNYRIATGSVLIDGLHVAGQ